MPPEDCQALVDDPRVGPGQLVQRLDKCKVVVVAVDPANEDKDELRKCAPSQTIYNDKIVPGTLVKFRVAAQVVCVDAPINPRFVFHLDEPIFYYLSVIGQIRIVEYDIQHK